MFPAAGRSHYPIALGSTRASPKHRPTVTLAIYPFEMSYPGDQGGGGYPPPRDPQDSQYPPPPGEEDDHPRGPYHNRGPSSGSNVTLPSISGYEQQYQPAPAGYPPDPRGYQSQPYRAPPGPYDDRGYQQDYGRGAPQTMSFTQSAPRQRTAIACRYCRRRKVSARFLAQYWHFDFTRPRSECSKSNKFFVFSPLCEEASPMTDHFADSLFWVRPKPRRSLLELPTFPARMYLHPRLLPSSSLRPSSRCLSRYAEHGGWT